MLLSEYEKSLLPKAIEFTKSTGKIPTTRELRKHLHCQAQIAAKLAKHINGGQAMPSGAHPKQSSEVAATQVLPKAAVTETVEATQDTMTLTLPKTRIKTLEGLLEYFKVDLDTWEVDHWIANKWEMGYKDEDDQPGTEELYQVKAWLRRKLAQNIDEYAVLCARQKSQLEKLRKDVQTERSISKRLALNHSGFDDTLADFKQLADTLGDLSLPYERHDAPTPAIIPVVYGGHDEDAVLLLSDTHFGDRIRREDTSGFPEFDLEISGNRMGYVVKKAKQVLTLHRAMYPIKTLYVWIGGDIGNGILHDSPNSNELFPPAQVHFGYHMLKFALEDLLTLTEPDENGTKVIEKIVIMYTVGNHMRLDEKMPHKYQAQRTMDWLIYQFITEHFQSNPKISIKQEISPFIFETIRGHRYMFIHGMQVGYRNSPDAQNKSIGDFLKLARGLFDSPEWRKANDLMGETFSRVCIGDIHIPLTFPRFKSNGSLNGQNELGVNWTLEPIPAGQQIFGVADKHQETWSYFLECTQVQKTKQDRNSYGKFASEYALLMGR